MAERTARQSNIELLRIVAAIGVVLLHFNNPSLGGGFSAVTNGSAEQFLIVFFESACICAVNLFVLISGYFMRKSMKRDILKPIELFTMYIVFELASYLIKELPKGNPFTISRFLRYFTASYWFIFVYITLYLISPYINVLMKHLGMKEKKTLLILLIILFSVYPIIMDSLTLMPGFSLWSGTNYGKSQGLSSIGLFGSGAGYTIINFVLMYIIGYYLKDIEEKGVKFKSLNLLVLYLINILVIVCWIYGESSITGLSLNFSTGLNYENPFVISEAVIVFLLFKNMKIKNNKIINILAAASFPTYLIHINLIYGFYFDFFISSGPFIFVIYMLGSLVAVYLICFVIFMIYDLITKPLFRFISGKWQTRRFIIVNEDSGDNQ